MAGELWLAFGDRLGREEDEAGSQTEMQERILRLQHGSMGAGVKDLMP